jgi:hypothetical protein
MKKCVLLFAMLAIPVFANETLKESSMTFTRQHDLLVTAIRNGSTSGEMQGEMGEHFTRELHSTGKLLVVARVIQPLSRDDCKRLEVIYTKKDVDTPEGRTDAILKTELNYCLDGSPPYLYGIKP